jgi:hypothetical protein
MLLTPATPFLHKALPLLLRFLFERLKVHLGLPCGFWCLNDKMIKELMSFANCEIGKVSCNYIEAIYSSRDMLWSI